MDRREAYRMTIGTEAPIWREDEPHKRAFRCVAFLLLCGVINRKDAAELTGRISGILHAGEEQAGEPRNGIRRVPEPRATVKGA